MSGWKDLLIDILKLTDEVKRLNQTIERLQGHVIDVDKRLVRLETLAEVSKYQKRIERD
jgi:uncharacterized protein YlxW (UPF0749 family)